MSKKQDFVTINSADLVTATGGATGGVPGACTGTGDHALLHTINNLTTSLNNNGPNGPNSQQAQMTNAMMMCLAIKGMNNNQAPAVVAAPAYYV